MTRIAIVGAGLVGAALAYEATRAGLDVVLLDRGRAGELGASRFGFGALSWGTATTPSTAAFAERGFQRYKDLQAELGGPAGFTPSESLSLLRDEAELAEAEHTVADSRARGRVARLLDHEALRLAEPALDTSGWAGAVATEQGHLDLAQCCRAWLRAAQASGRCSLREGVEVDSIDAAGCRLQTGDGAVEADLTVLAAGAWVRPLLERAGIELPVFHSRAEFLYTSPVAPVLRYQVIWGGADRERAEAGSVRPELLPCWFEEDAAELRPPVIEHALVQFPGGELHLGQITRLSPSLAPGADPSSRGLLLDSVRPLLPAVDSLPDLRLDVRPVAFTPDHLPIVDAPPGLPQTLLVATARSPVILVPALAEAVVDWAAHGRRAPELDEWRLDRPALRAVRERLASLRAA